jgi:proteasome activator subunit 4
MCTPNLPSLQTLRIDDDEGTVAQRDAKADPAFNKLQAYAKSLPYSIESNSKMQSLLDFYLMRFVQVSIGLA